MAGDDVDFFNRLVQHFCGFLSHIEVAGTVSAVTTDAVLFVQAVWQGIEVRLFRHGLMERGIKHGHVFIFQTREGFQCFSDTDQVSRVMQRCERRRVFDTTGSRSRRLPRNWCIFRRRGRYGDQLRSAEQTVLVLCQNSVNDKVQRFTVSGACT